jgi:ribosomal protein S18 acetylase RimI-like enzyme
VIIREFRNDDLAPTVALWRRARFASQPWLEQRVPHSVDDDFEHFRRVILVDHFVFVAESDARVAGFASLRGALLGHLYVDPPAQGQGLGSALLDHAKSLSPSGLSLFTHQRNQRARMFYERRGFQIARLGVSPPPENEPDVEYVWAPLLSPTP